MSPAERDQIADLRVFLTGEFSRNHAAHDEIKGRLSALETVQDAHAKAITEISSQCKSRGVFGKALCFAGAVALAIKAFVWR